MLKYNRDPTESNIIEGMSYIPRYYKAPKSYKKNECDDYEEFKRKTKKGKRNENNSEK